MGDIIKKQRETNWKSTLLLFRVKKLKDIQLQSDFEIGKLPPDVVSYNNAKSKGSLCRYRNYALMMTNLTKHNFSLRVT